MTNGKPSYIMIHRPILYISKSIPKTTQHAFSRLYPRDVLYAKFSPFGALYEIQIMESNHGNQLPSDQNHGNQLPSVIDSAASSRDTPLEANLISGGLYAFVKFYSARAASKAKKELSGRLFIAGQHMRLRYSTRQAPEELTPLYYTKCYELANHYLGFNGWSIAIIMCRENKEHSAVVPDHVQYVSGVKLHIPRHGVFTEGYGVATTSYSTTDPCSKSVAICQAKKQSYQQAIQNAFSRVMLVVLDNGKVYVDINSTVEDRVFCDEQLTVDNILKVNDLNLDPDQEVTDSDDDVDMDALNKHLLEDLEAENT